MSRDRRHPVGEPCLLTGDDLTDDLAPAPRRRRGILVAIGLVAITTTVLAGLALASDSCRGRSCDRDGDGWRSSTDDGSRGDGLVVRFSTTRPLAPSVASDRVTPAPAPAPAAAPPPAEPTAMPEASLAATAAPVAAAIATSATAPVTTTATCKRRRCASPTTTPTTLTDTAPPSVPTGQKIPSVTATAITMAWIASTDNVGVAGYEAWLDGKLVGKTSATTYTYTGLTCGVTRTVGLVAYDAAGNRSDRAFASGPASTSACTPIAPASTTTPTPAPPAPTPVPPAPTPVPPAPTPAPPAPVPATPTGLVVPSTVVELSGTVTPAAFNAAVAAKAAGPLLVRPAAGAAAFTVSGALYVTRPGLMIKQATLTGIVTFAPGANGSSFVGGKALGFNIFGADDVTVSGSTFDGQGMISNNQIWDQPAGSTPDRFRILGNLIRNYYGPTPESHSEGLYVGYSKDGLIEGNTFVNNGNTAHVFFTWFGNLADPATSYPRNMCVRGNTFGATHGAYFAVNSRAEIPASSGIDVEPSPSNVIPAGLGFATDAALVRAC